MKFKTPISYITSFLFVFLMIVGIQYSADAQQIRVVNGTDCTLDVKAGQNSACSACNSSGVITLIPGAGFQHFLNGCSIPQWLGVKWSGLGGVGTSYNPWLFSSCGTDVNSDCLGNQVSANWFTAGPFGQAYVFITD